MPARSHAAQSPEPQVEDALDLLAALIAVGLIALAVTGRSGPPRTILALAFALFVPGRAIVANWRRFSGWSQAAIAMVISICLLTLVATVFLWAHLWNPMLMFDAEAGVSLAGLALAAARRHQDQLARLRPVRPARSPGGSA